MRKMVLLLIMVMALQGCSAISYEEGKLYSEKNLEGYNETSTEELQDKGINREDIINKILYIVKNGFGIDIDRKEAYEMVKIGKTNDKFQWNIELTDKNNSFYCQIDCDSGEVIEIANYQKSFYGNSTPADISEEKVKLLITPLANEMGIELENYTMKIEILKVVYIYLHNEEQVSSIFTISNDGEKIISYKNVKAMSSYYNGGKNEDFNN